MGTTPTRLVRPTVGLMPTTPLTPAGQTMEPSVSVPTETAQRFAATAGGACPVEPLGDLDRVRVQLEHRVEARARPVETLDAGDVALDDGARGQAALPHHRLQLHDGRFFQIQPLTSRTRTYSRSN